MFSIYLFSTYDMPDAIPGSRDASVNKINNVSLIWSLIPIAEVNNKKRKSILPGSIKYYERKKTL